MRVVVGLAVLIFFYLYSLSFAEVSRDELRQARKDAKILTRQERFSQRTLKLILVESGSKVLLKFEDGVDELLCRLIMHFGPPVEHERRA